MGESTAWLTRVSTIKDIVAAGAATGITFSTVWAQVRLATGETIHSEDVVLDSLPRD